MGSEDASAAEEPPSVRAREASRPTGSATTRTAASDGASDGDVFALIARAAARAEMGRAEPQPARAQDDRPLREARALASDAETPERARPGTEIPSIVGPASEATEGRGDDRPASSEAERSREAPGARLDVAMTRLSGAAGSHLGPPELEPREAEWPPAPRKGRRPDTLADPIEDDAPPMPAADDSIESPSGTDPSGSVRPRRHRRRDLARERCGDPHLPRDARDRHAGRAAIDAAGGLPPLLLLQSQRIRGETKRQPSIDPGATGPVRPRRVARRRHASADHRGVPSRP